MTLYSPTALDLSRLTPPEAIETISFPRLISAGKSRFLAEWAAQQGIDPSLPDFTEDVLETHPAIVVLRVFAGLRGLDRFRVNDALKALMAPLSRGGDLEQIAASRNLERLVVVPATAGSPEVRESDEALLRRYLLSFDAPCAGSAGRYLFDAWSAWPQSADKTLGLWDARVNGRAVHGRRGDTDVVIIGPFGRLPTSGELSTVRAAVTDPNRAPEAVGISVLAATRVEYSVSLVIEVSATGPAAETIREEAVARVTAAATDRILVGGEVPAGLLAGAAYGPGVIKVRDLAPVAIDADPYKVPVMTSITIVPEVR